MSSRERSRARPAGAPARAPGPPAAGEKGAGAAASVAALRAGAPVSPAEVVRLQRTLGNGAVGRLLAARRAAPAVSGGARGVQRMVQVGNNLYYDPARTGLPGGRLAEYEQNLATLTGAAPQVITGANLAAMLGIPPGGLADALTQKLENDRLIFQYYPPLNEESFRLSLTNEQTRPILAPRDMLDEPDDLAAQYDAGKACVLQALINVGVQHPELAGVQQESPAAWHHLLYNQKGMQYDDTTAVFQLYTSLGLTLVMNRPTLWKNIDRTLLTPGRYVFSMPGHNFGVVVDGDGAFHPVDEPQRRIIHYEPDQPISYVWRVG